MLSAENQNESTVWVQALARATSAVLSTPFDIALNLYAVAVKGGLIKDSLVASARFSHALHSVEKLALGPWARGL